MTWFPEAALDRDRWRGVTEDAVARGAVAIANGRFPATLMLTGPRGAGRELAAVELATLLVIGDDTLRPWRETPVTHRVRSGNHPDVAAVLPEESGKRTIRVATVRDVVEAAPSRPYEGACRVWIIDGVESAGIEVEAANALLKVLEEPPAHVHFILLAEAPSAVLSTIRSRSARLGLPGAVGVATRLDAGDPPELTGRGMDATELGEMLTSVVQGITKIAEGDALAAVRLATSLSAHDDAFTVLSAGALQWALETPDATGEAGTTLADACLEADRAVRTLGVLRPHQVLGVLLAWMRDTVPDARANQR